MSTVESMVPGTLNGTGGNSAPVGGKRHHKLKLVTRKSARKALKKLGMKMRGGVEESPSSSPPSTPTTAGRRHRGGKKTRRRSASHRPRRASSLFGL